MSTFITDHDFVSNRGMAPGRHLASPAAANSVRVSAPPKKTKSPPRNGSTATTRRPVEVEPVASLTQPIRYGPPKPSRLPIELISAIAPAAAVPESQASGSVQNSAKVQKVPIAATTSATTVTYGLSM